MGQGKHTGKPWVDQILSRLSNLERARIQLNLSLCPAPGTWAHVRSFDWNRDAPAVMPADSGYVDALLASKPQEEGLINVEIFNYSVFREQSVPDVKGNIMVESADSAGVSEQKDSDEKDNSMGKSADRVGLCEQVDMSFNEFAVNHGENESANTDIPQDVSSVLAGPGHPRWDDCLHVCSFLQTNVRYDTSIHNFKISVGELEASSYVYDAVSVGSLEPDCNDLSSEQGGGFIKDLAPGQPVLHPVDGVHPADLLSVE